ncbi:flagellar hook-length control protein FliK [Devosia sp. CN2-171]|uniref:flagellar hook-length control protein FliK n=1 Tax=Devosia sp. CN2-171 TaxID=3400909 RepID=UPI003BF7BD24
MPLQQVLADPVQAAARQTTVAPLLAQATAALVAPAASALPLPVLEALARVMAGRIDLNRTPPDGKALRQAVLSAGTLEAGPRQPDDMRATLLALRSTLASFLGGKVDAVAPIVHRPAPPMAGEPPRAPQPTPAAPVPDLSPEETAKHLLSHTDSALARTKLLQLASSPPDARSPGQVTGPELRFEIPMLLGAETGILQLLVQRDGRHKPDPRERGWRMRFAMRFSAIGEIGADIALLGRAANVSIWAAEPATADALEAMLPELAPALASHGLDVAGLRVRRGMPPRRPQAPGQLLDSAR